MITQGEHYLVTTDCYFIAPDGEEYRAVWGVCRIVTTEQAFGFTPARPSTNWFLQVGEGERQVVVAGCQIHYCVRCAERPTEKPGRYDIPNTQTDKTVINKIYFTT